MNVDGSEMVCPHGHDAGWVKSADGFPVCYECGQRLQEPDESNDESEGEDSESEGESGNAES